MGALHDFLHCHCNICLDLMAKRKEENFFSPENAKRPRQEELDDFDKDECDNEENHVKHPYNCSIYILKKT